MEKGRKINNAERLRDLLGERNWKDFVKNLETWIGDVAGKEIKADLMNLKVEYKRDRQQAVNTAITGRVEEKLKEVICPRIPKWITPDHLTALGVVAIIITAVGYIFGFINRNFLILVPIGLFLNWFGDSFDGSIARYRKKTRPNYGYYIDKIVDAIVVLIFALSIGLSGFVKIGIALLFACVYLALMLHVGLVVHIQNKAQNSFGFFGPTEIRILGVLATVLMYFLPVYYTNILGHWLTQYDFLTLGGSVIMFLVLIGSIFSKGIELHKEDTKDW